MVKEWCPKRLHQSDTILSWLRCSVADVQVKAREEALAKDEERHKQLKEESKKQVRLLAAACCHSMPLCTLTATMHKRCINELLAPEV